MDSRVPKNEREWWASREIEKLERELTAANKRIADCEFLLEHRYKIIQQQEPRCNEAIARAEKAEAALHALRLVCGTSDADKFTTWLNVEIAKREKAEAELANIANAKPDTWGDMSDSFQAWAQNRARHALAAMKGTP
jgi:hypothetical protein